MGPKNTSSVGRTIQLNKKQIIPIYFRKSLKLFSRSPSFDKNSAHAVVITFSLCGFFSLCRISFSLSLSRFPSRARRRTRFVRKLECSRDKRLHAYPSPDRGEIRAKRRVAGTGWRCVYTAVNAYPCGKEEREGEKERKDWAPGGWNICQCCALTLAEMGGRERMRRRTRERKRERETYDAYIHANDVYARTPRTVQSFSTRSLEIWDPLDKAGPSLPPSLSLTGSRGTS